MSAHLRLTLLGTGSSSGVPRIGNDWGACDPGEPRNRRRRCSALLERVSTDAQRPTRLLIDTAPDLREQLLDACVGELDSVVISHDHADQTHGLDDLRVIALRMRRQVPIFMDAPTAATLTRKFDYCFEGKGGYPPILARQPEIEPARIFAVDGPAGPLEVLPIRQEHGWIESLGFRCGPIAYCNDVNMLPEEAFEALCGVEILVVDALRYAPHPSHANLEMALGWIERIRPRQAVLTNLHIDMDYRTLARELPEGVVPGHDGMILEASL